MGDTIIRVIYEDTTYDLEIDGSIPLRLNMSAVEVGSVGEIFGVGSQTFTLPGNKANNRFFNHAYDIGVSDVPGLYNSLVGYIILKGETILRGQFYLLEVIRDEEGYVSYNCQITDDVVQLKDNLANQFISTADWTAYNHTFTSASIIDSWSGNLLSGSVFYPIAEYGDEDEDTALVKIGFSGGGTGKYFDKSTTPLSPQQLIPSIRVRDVLSTVINQAGFRATGSFFESERFRDLYLLPKAQEGVGFVPDTSTSGSTAIAKVRASDDAIFLSSSYPSPSVIPYELCPTSLSPQFTCYDPQGEWSNNHYNMSDIGKYEFEVNYLFFNPFNFGQTRTNIASCTLGFELMVGTYSAQSGTVIDSQEIFVERKPFDYGFQNAIPVQLGAEFFNVTPNQDVWVQVRVTNPVNLETSRIIPRSQGQFFYVKSAPGNIEGVPVLMSLQFPSDLRSIDVVNGIIQQFNLILIPDYDRKNVIEVQTFDDWMLSGSNVDWTDKFNAAERISISHTVDEVQREVVYTSAKDSDRFSQVTIKNEPGDQYGTLRVLADNNISQGTRTITNNFAPLILASSFLYDSDDEEGNPTYNVDLNSRFAVPHLYKFENNRITSFKFKPRIGYKVNNAMPSGSSFYFGVAGSANEFSGSYTTIGNVEHLPVTGSVTKDLLYNNTYASFTTPALAMNSGISNFDNYFKLYTDSLYWEDSRKVTMDIKFKPKEYTDIRLNDHVFIKDQQYRINKISGFNVSNSDVVTVELIKLYPAYYGPIFDRDELCTFEGSGSYIQDGVCAITPPSPIPTPTAPLPPAPAPVSSIPQFSFVAGKQPDAERYGFHRGTLFGCPATIGYGTTTQEIQALPGTDCYSFNCLGTSNALVSKGYGILSRTGASTGLVLNQVETNPNDGTVFFALMNIDGNNIGNPIKTGTIVGNDGKSATFQVDFLITQGYIDDSCNGVPVDPESYGFGEILSGDFEDFVVGVSYTIQFDS